MPMGRPWLRNRSHDEGAAAFLLTWVADVAAIGARLDLPWFGARSVDRGPRGASVARFRGPVVPRFRGSVVPWFYGSRASGLCGSWAPGLQGFRALRLLGFGVSGFQCSRVSGFQGFRAPGFQASRAQRAAIPRFLSSRPVCGRASPSPDAIGQNGGVPHLPRPAQIHPGLATIPQRQALASIEARASLQMVQPLQSGRVHGIELALDAAIPRHRHREGPQVVQHQTRQFGLTEPTGRRQAVVVHLAALEGAVHKHQLQRLRRLIHPPPPGRRWREPARLDRAPCLSILMRSMSDGAKTGRLGQRPTAPAADRRR